MNDGKVTLNRPLVGVIALACLCASAFFGFSSSPTSENNYWMWAGAFGRVGVLMATLWIALPSKHQAAAWANVTPATFVGLTLAVAGVALRPKIAIPLLLVLAVMAYVLRPRAKQRPPRDFL